MLARARAKVAGLTGRHRLRVGDAHRLDFPDATFDVVLNSYMFDLLPEANFDPILAEFRRVLKPGGRLVLVNMAHGTSRLQRVWELVYRASPALLGGCRGVGLEAHVAAAGFGDVRRSTVSQLSFPSELITATLS